jgi:hypothetical protein
MRRVLSLFIVNLFLVTSLVAFSSTSASEASTLTTCTDLSNQKIVVLKANQKNCKPFIAPALWRLNQQNSSNQSGQSYATLRICSSKNVAFTYRHIKKSCPKFQVTTDYLRAIATPSVPVISSSSAVSYNGAFFTLATIIQSADTPIAYYLITNINTGQVSKISLNSLGQLSLSGLNPRTSYTFQIAAVSVDGTSPSSAISPVITTGAVPVVIVAPVAATLASPAFTLTSSAETKTVNNAMTGYTISSTGGAIASYAISPAAPSGTTFSASSGLLTGTPTSTQSATTYAITATNVSGSATRTFSFTVSPLAAPAFTLSASAETRTVNTVATGFTISSIGGTIASFAIDATPAGMSFNTTTGALTGTPSTVAAATSFTITATNASGSATQTFTLTITAIVYIVGDTGPSGGKIFYVATTPFSCGPTRTATCTYLEAAPALWNDGAVEPARLYAQVDYQNTAVSGDTRAPGASPIGWGYQNTRAIILQGNTNTATSAAALADSHTVTVSGVLYDDWYLPSRNELNQMCKWARGITGVDLTTLTTVCTGGTLNTDLGFVKGLYWSSTEYNDASGYFQVIVPDFFAAGFQGGNGKSNLNNVRPIRAF